jgi:hypothetical protein
MGFKKLKTLTKADHVTIIFGEWFDKVNGNTYYDAEIFVGDHVHRVPYCYGYNHGDKQAIDESLAKIGYKVRVNRRNVHAPYRHLHVRCADKLKRDLFTVQSRSGTP